MFFKPKYQRLIRLKSSTHSVLTTHPSNECSSHPAMHTAKRLSSQNRRHARWMTRTGRLPIKTSSWLNLELAIMAKPPEESEIVSDKKPKPSGSRPNPSTATSRTRGRGIEHTSIIYSLEIRKKHSGGYFPVRQMQVLGRSKRICICGRKQKSFSLRLQCMNIQNLEPDAIWL